MLAFWLEIFLSDKIREVLPSLTAVSASSRMISILSFKDVLKKVYEAYKTQGKKIIQQKNLILVLI